MIIKVCGMRAPENIRAVNELGVDLIGLIFDKTSPRFVSLVNSRAGIIPDRVDENAKETLSSTNAKFVGVFVDEMPQTVITNVYNFNLDYVQLNGEESTVYIDNLRATLDPDIHAGIKIIKTVKMSSIDDIKTTKQFEGHADLLMFDMHHSYNEGSDKQVGWSLLNAYNGDLPFILSGDIGSDDAQRVLTFHHPKCIGIDLNLEFEAAPAVKDVEKLRVFIDKIRRV